MNIVSDFIAKEVQLKVAHLAKIEALKKKIANRQAGGQGQTEDEKGEIDEMQAKLDKLDLPEETKQITVREMKKLRQLGPRN